MWDHHNNVLHSNGSPIHRYEAELIDKEIIIEWSNHNALPWYYSHLFWGSLNSRLKSTTIHQKKRWLTKFNFNSLCFCPVLMRSSNASLTGKFKVYRGTSSFIFLVIFELNKFKEKIIHGLRPSSVPSISLFGVVSEHTGPIRSALFTIIA